jgi:hypothetical protein
VALRTDPDFVRQERAFHKAVFALWGDRCVFCGKRAFEAAHVLSRSMLGKKLRFASEHFARPTCAWCHRDLHRHVLAWPDDIIADAKAAHNAIAKVELKGASLR